MQAFIQYVKGVSGQASHTASQCNYSNNYYGDQVCALVSGQEATVVTVLDSYALSHG